MLQMERTYDRLLCQSTASGLNDTELLLSTPSYGTMPLSPKRGGKNHKIIKISKKVWKLLRSECLLSSVVIIFGVAATFTSTLYNIFDIQDLNQFWSPCIRNISLSKLLLPK
jgi:hypothetical protein